MDTVVHRASVRPTALVVLPLLAIVATALNLRTAVTGFSPLLETIGDQLGFGAALFGVFGTIITASFAVFGLVTPIVATRVGLEATIAVATLLTTAGILLRAFSAGAPMLIASSIVAFAGIGASNVLVVPLVKKYYPDHLKSVSSLYLALLQLGQFTAPLVAVPMALAVGWRPAVGVWALLTAVACVLWVVVARRAGGTRGERGAGAVAGTPARLARVAGAWRTPVLWSLVLMFAMTALNTYAIITWLPTILVDAGADPTLGGSLLALFSCFGLLAAFVVPPLTLRLRNPVAVVLVCAALLALGYVGLMLAPLAGAVVWVVALGLGVSTFPMCLTLVNARTRTPAGSSALSGAMQGVGYAIACVGPLGIGVLFGLTGTWTASFVLLFASLVVLVLSGIVACRPSRLEDQAEEAVRA